MPIFPDPRAVRFRNTGIQHFQIFYNFVTAPSSSLLNTNLINIVIYTKEFLM
jgi:hypothetical protein